MPWITIPMVVLLPGCAALLSFGAPRAPGQFLLRAGAAGLLIASWCALALAQLSLFSVGALTALLAASSLGPLVLRRRQSAATLRAIREKARGSLPPPAMVFALGAVVIAAAVLAARPGEHYGGGWDPGVYLSAGASVARHGGLIVRDPLLASLDKSEKTLLFPALGTGMKYPGFYVHDPVSGTIVPQFQPLYPVLLAVAIALLGDRAALYVNPALALAGILLLFQLATALRGRLFGLAAAALLALNVVQIWNSRFTTSEVTAQVLLLAGFVFLRDFLDEGDMSAGALAGLAFGMAPMATVTTVLVLPFACAAALLPGGIPGRAARWTFTAALVAALGHLALWSAVISPHYVVHVSTFFPGARRWLPVAAATLTVLGCAAWAVARQPVGFRASLHRAAAMALALLIPVGLAVFWSGRLGGPPGLLKLSWFISPGVIVLFAAGVSIMLASNRNRAETAFVLGGCAMLFFFLYEPRMYPSYPFLLRRYTPLVIPVVAYAAAFIPAALLSTGRLLPRTAGSALLALALAVPLAQNRDLVRRTEYAGLGKLITEIDARLPRGGILLCEGQFLAYAMEHFAGRQVVILNRVEPARAAGILDFVRRRLAAGEQVLLLSHAETPWVDGMVFEPLFTRRFETTRREQELNVYPGSIRQIDLAYTGYRVLPAGDTSTAERFPAHVDLGESALGLGPGFSVAKAIGGGAWARWTMAVAELDVPWPTAPGTVEVALRLASGESRSVLARVRLSVDGAGILADDLVVPAGMTELHFTVAQTPAPRAWRKLRIESSTWNPADAGIAGFPRALGVLVDWVEIRPANSVASRP